MVKRVASSFCPPQNPEEDQEGLRGATCPKKFWGSKGTAATVCSAEAHSEPRANCHITLTQGTEDTSSPTTEHATVTVLLPVVTTKMGTNASRRPRTQTPDPGLQNTGQSHSTAVLSEITRDLLQEAHFKAPLGLSEK